MSKRLLPIIVLLAGCASAPDYQRPVAPVPAVFPGAKVDTPRVLPSGRAQTTASTVVNTVTDWRKIFTDPGLQTLIAAALEHNRDLRVAVGRVEEARALAGVARADRLPTLDVSAQRAASLTPGDLSATGRPLNTQRYDASLGVSAFELDFWGRVKNLDAAARAVYLASEEARRAFQAALIADVANTWLTQLELAERLALTTATVESRTQTRFLIGKRRDVGLAGEIDYLQADGAYQNTLAEAASLARQQAATANALQLLVGTNIGVSPPSTFQSIAIAEPQEGLVSDTLLARPDVRAAEQKLIAAHANINAARAAFLPKILLTATAGTASRALSGLFAAGSGAWAFAPVLRLPIFDAGRNAENLDVALARKNIAVAEYEKTLQQAFREVADLLTARQHLAAQIVAQEANTNAQSSRLKLVEARYNAGVSNHLELLDAQREHFAAQQSTLTIRRQQWLTTVNLYKALGVF
jgi:multidrug efflux system outer membrane protein